LLEDLENQDPRTQEFLRSYLRGKRFNWVEVLATLGQVRITGTGRDGVFVWTFDRAA